MTRTSEERMKLALFVALTSMVVTLLLIAVVVVTELQEV